MPSNEYQSISALSRRDIHTHHKVNVNRSNYLDNRKTVFVCQNGLSASIDNYCLYDLAKFS